MPAITIRNVPSEVRDELAARAARSGRSLQEYLSQHLAALAARPDLNEVVTRARTRSRVAGVRLQVDDVVADRDAERR